MHFITQFTYQFSVWLGGWILCRCIHACLCVCFLPGSCMVRDASGLLNDTLSPSSSGENCVVLSCQYGWDFTECINNNTCTYGISNYYQVSASSLTHKTQKLVECVFVPLSMPQWEALIHIVSCWGFKPQADSLCNSLEFQKPKHLPPAATWGLQSVVACFFCKDWFFFFSVRNRNCTVKTVTATSQH